MIIVDEVLVASPLDAEAENMALVPEMLKNQLLVWLSPADSSNYYNEARERRTERTGDCFMVGPFQKWQKANQSFLWLYGKGRHVTLLHGSLVFPDPSAHLENFHVSNRFEVWLTNSTVGCGKTVLRYGMIPSCFGAQYTK